MSIRFPSKTFDSDDISYGTKFYDDCQLPFKPMLDMICPKTLLCGLVESVSCSHKNIYNKLHEYYHDTTRRGNTLVSL